MAMATVRRRAVYALAVLALLCGCCSSVCGATTSSKVKANVLCPSKGGKVRWRVSGESNWKECHNNLKHFVSAGNNEIKESICMFAESWCPSIMSGKKSPSHPEGKSSNDVVFTMDCTTDGNSELHKLLKGGAATTRNDGDLLDISGNCKLSHLQLADGVTPGPQTPVAQQPQIQTAAATAPSSEGTQQGEISAGSSAGTGVPDSNAAEQSGSAGSTEHQETLTSPTGAVDSSKATGDSGAQAPSASAQPSGTSTSNTPAGSDGGSATTTTTTSSPSGGKHIKSNADGSGTPTVWVRGTLLLLLTAAVACAAGE
ncbi:mucin-like glycoprotein [Trypanosoma rangeli]|uniref:Mucin-like glycoprotein n=1 Tax=Trypanosoma rangeli TaxID=5698 RepID=A0A3R7MTH2_TRYRA|nr:mucin-like glycoprotein [Trypanosoma rangeli]RNE94987.1 mucin-like glycoprotein [Trypanosoma rangeli]|eukprot:RNE94987.1 mucin-like glycoprotein [Trypanosoma rangeli]